MEKRLLCSHSVFPTPDIKRTADYYEKVMGFRAVKYMDAKEPHICLYRDDTEIILTGTEKRVVPNREIYGYGYDAYFITDDQAALQEELREAGGKNRPAIIKDRLSQLGVRGGGYGWPVDRIRDEGVGESYLRRLCPRAPTPFFGEKEQKIRQCVRIAFWLCYYKKLVSGNTGAGELCSPLSHCNDSAAFFRASDASISKSRAFLNGSKLMDAIQEECTKEGLYIYLETEKEENLSFYEKHGLTVLQSVTLKKIHLPLWQMGRKP
jgi:catechol 2,3-dioxygenase-like lactoylglutathione lyase family enzyme